MTRKRSLLWLTILCALLCVLMTFCVVTVGAETAPPFESIVYGMQGDQVTEVQQKLKDLGYYTGRVSGNFLDGTFAAVKRFQKDYGIEQTGQVDENTYGLLMTAQYKVLRNGEDGQAVTRLQENLISLGYLNTKATGKFRSATEAAVRAFQQHNGLEATGVADVTTQQLLFSTRALAKGAQPTPTPGPDADVGDINDVVMVEDGQGTADSREEIAYRKRLVRGSEGSDVKRVQNRLTELGFFDGPISGYYMNQTMAAVKVFQEYNGLMVSDGEMDEETWNALFNAADVVSAECTPRPTPVPTMVPYYVVVDVQNQVTKVYGIDENGEYTIPVRNMICSTGMVSTPSDVGDWVTNGRRAQWAYFSLYGSHARYWTRINEDIAFHSVIYNEVDNMALSVKSYNKLGSRASHGCIRLLVSDAKWVYDNIRAGTTVHITEDLPVDEELRYAVKQPRLNKELMWPATTPVPTVAPAYDPQGLPPQPFRMLQRDSSGEDVYWLQCKLRDLGYYTGTVTGSYYRGTTNAVKAYQKDHGLYPDGKAGIKTLESIYADVLAASTPSPSPDPEATPSPAPTMTPEPTPCVVYVTGE
ncbi:MAG: peptidoglycan-binding protein [Clostridia bacterium]|nr:peptidoglycan-binding protein [Clostridia bacterium]